MIEMYSFGKLPLAEEQLTAVEKHFGIKFPDSYRQFMLQTNGGIPMIGSFDCKDGIERSAVNNFYYILPGDDNDIIVVNENRQGRFPDGFVSIAPDGGGNAICIDCKAGPEYGKVYFWDHEREADPDQGQTPETAGNVHLLPIASLSFWMAFLNDLCQKVGRKAR